MFLAVAILQDQHARPDRRDRVAVGTIDTLLCQPPPAQIPASGATALGSYLGS